MVAHIINLSEWAINKSFRVWNIPLKKKKQKVGMELQKKKEEDFEE
jgi:hypothetical protein